MKRVRGPAHKAAITARPSIACALRRDKREHLGSPSRRRSDCALYTGLHPGARQMAFFQDQRPSREPFLNAPAIVFWLIGVLVAAHVGRELLPQPWPQDLLRQFAFNSARYSAAALAASGNPEPGLVDQ